jgi:hypothetical protein
MRITTFDLDEHKPCGIEIPLRRLAASSEPLEAASWNKLLELVTHLQLSGSEHELWGQLVLKELLLHKPDPPDPVRDREMKKFIDEWRAENPDPTAWGNHLGREMRRRFPTKPGVHVSLWADWRDYAPLRDGLPDMHYRFQVKRPGKSITEDARAKDPAEAEQIIRQAFGW